MIFTSVEKYLLTWGILDVLSKSLPLGAWWTSVHPDGPPSRFGLHLSFSMPAFHHSRDISFIFYFLIILLNASTLCCSLLSLGRLFHGLTTLKQSYSFWYQSLSVSLLGSSRPCPLAFFLHPSPGIGLSSLLCPISWQLWMFVPYLGCSVSLPMFLFLGERGGGIL